MSVTFVATRCFRCAQRTSLASARPFTTSSAQQNQSPPVVRHKRRDPYAMAQAKAKKAANQSRQQVLSQERAASLGDPVRGIETAFVASFDKPPPDTHLNFFVSESQLGSTMKRSQWLNTPSESDLAQQEEKVGAENARAIREQVRNANERAEEALRRISSLNLGSSQDRIRLNVQRCIDTFGRHNTDGQLARKPSANTDDSGKVQELSQRIGADTGSSEVQIAILTAKIRALANNLAGHENKDKHNKRNLRLLVHRRQRLLQYLRRKERGGPRWQNVISTLGLTEGTWKGEITLR